MFLVPFFDLQNFILLVRTLPFLRKIFFISSYTAKNNYFLLYELIQDLPYKNFIVQILMNIQIFPLVAGNSSRLQEGIFVNTLVKFYNKANLIYLIRHKDLSFIVIFSD